LCNPSIIESTALGEEASFPRLVWRKLNNQRALSREPRQCTFDHTLYHAESDDTVFIGGNKSTPWFTLELLL
jgi:hypothetical protein